MTSVDAFLGLTSLGAKPDMEQVNNAIKMDDPYEVVRMFCEANGMGREDFTASSDQGDARRRLHQKLTA